jgi:DNA phosphorothioation-dependent restriction protein DptG
MADYEIPKFPCVVMRAQKTGIVYSPTGDRTVYEVEEPLTEYIHVKIHTSDQMSHIDHLRKTKKWPVVGFHNLEKIVDEHGRVPQGIKNMIAELSNIITSPEMQLANEQRKQGKK